MTDHTELLARHREQWTGKQHHGLTFGDLNILIELQAAAIRELQAQIIERETAAKRWHLQCDNAMEMFKAERKAREEADVMRHESMEALGVVVEALRWYIKYSAITGNPTVGDAALDRVTSILHTGEMPHLQRAAAAESRLREVEAATKERCAVKCDENADKAQEEGGMIREHAHRHDAFTIRALAQESEIEKWKKDHAAWYTTRDWVSDEDIVRFIAGQKAYDSVALAPDQTAAAPKDIEQMRATIRRYDIAANEAKHKANDTCIVCHGSGDIGTEQDHEPCTACGTTGKYQTPAPAEVRVQRT